MYNPVKEEIFNIKTYNSGGKGVVVSTPGEVDRNCSIGMAFTVQYKLKNGQLVNQVGFHTY